MLALSDRVENIAPRERTAVLYFDVPVFSIKTSRTSPAQRSTNHDAHKNHLFDVLHPRIFPDQSHGEPLWPKHLEHPSDERIVARQANVRLEGRVAEVWLGGNLSITTTNEQQQS